MRRRSAFTLVELLLVIAILALLTGVAVPALIGVHQQVNVKICAHNLRGASNALRFYGDQYKRFPPAQDVVQVGGVYYERSAHDFLTAYMGHGEQLMQMPLDRPCSDPRYRPKAFTCPAADRELPGYHFALAPGVFHRPSLQISTVEGHVRIPSGGYLADSTLAYMVDGHSMYMLVPALDGINLYRHAVGDGSVASLGANYQFADGHVEFSRQYHRVDLSEAPWKLPESVP